MSEIDVRGLLAELGVEARRRGRVWLAACPLPDHDESEPSWSIVDSPGRQDHGHHYCFGCKRGGGPVSLVGDVRGISFSLAHEWLQERGLETFGVELAVSEIEVDSRAPEFRKKLRHPEGVKFGPIDKWPTPARRYLDLRMISREQVERWRIGYAIDGRLAGRIYFPFEDSGGRLLGYSARSFDGRSPRYLTPRDSEGPDPGALFGEAHWPASGRVLVLAEGAIKALACDRAGAPNIGAPGGSQLSTLQTRKLSRWPRIVLVRDSDSAGSNFADELFSSIRRWSELIVVSCPPKIDADMMELDELRRMIGPWLES